MTQKNNALTTQSNESAKAKNICNNFSMTQPAWAISVMEKRALHALISAGNAGISRKALDEACATSNSPEVVRKLRNKGFVIHCDNRAVKNRFGDKVLAGYYSLVKSPKHTGAAS